MRQSVLIFAIVVGLELGPSSVRAAPATPFDAGQITELISQLGSAKFKEREAATQALDAIGKPALEALQQAARSSDPEVGRRAQNLARLIRKRIETAQFLAPLRLRLVFKDTPVVQAVGDFAKKAGFPIEIISPRARPANQKITLDTGDTSFWEAFDQFCREAGLVERTTVPDSDPQTAPVSGATVGKQRGVHLVELPLSLGTARGWDGRLVLVDGRPQLLPTCHAGAVRIRALPVAAARTAGDEIQLMLEITPQPKMLWHNVVDLRIDKAVDEHGQDLAPSPDRRNEWNSLAVTANGGLLVEAWTGRPGTAFRDIPAHLKSGDKPSGILKEIKGVVAAQVETALQPMITVENIYKSVGRTFVSEYGESLKLIEARRQADGDIHVRIELNDTSRANAQWVLRRGVLRPNRLAFANGVVRRGVVVEDGAAPLNLVLQDVLGQSFHLRDREEGMVVQGNVLAHEIALTYRVSPGLGEPSKLVYSGRRTMIIEVPFTLKDVPLR